jgi:hypothetical protein
VKFKCFRYGSDGFSSQVVLILGGVLPFLTDIYPPEGTKGVNLRFGRAAVRTSGMDLEPSRTIFKTMKFFMFHLF